MRRRGHVIPMRLNEREYRYLCEPVEMSGLPREEYLRGLDKRKEEVPGSIEAQNAMTPELQAALAGAKTLAEVEDIYRPYKPMCIRDSGIGRCSGFALRWRRRCFCPTASLMA